MQQQLEQCAPGHKTPLPSPFSVIVVVDRRRPRRIRKKAYEKKTHRRVDTKINVITVIQFTSLTIHLG